MPELLIRSDERSICIISILLYLLQIHHIMSPIKLNEINAILKELKDQIEKYPQLQNNFEVLKAYQGNDPNRPPKQSVSILTEIRNILSSIVLREYYPNQEEILSRMGFLDLIGDRGVTYLNSVIASAANSSMTISGPEIKRLISNLSDFIFNIPVTFYYTSKFAEEIHAEEDEVIIEVVFDDMASIDNFKDAKKEMGDWSLIVNALAKLTGGSVDDFPIVSFSKNSPTRTSFKCKAATALLVLEFFKVSTELAKSVIEYKQSMDMVIKSDPEMAEENTKRREVRSAEIIKEGGQKITTNIIATARKDKSINNDVNKGIEKQVNFVNNGGTINVYLGTEENSEVVAELKEAQAEIKRLNENNENRKKISEHSDTEEVDDTDSTDNNE